MTKDPWKDFDDILALAEEIARVATHNGAPRGATREEKAVKTIERMEGRIKKLILENWQLKGALGYMVPAHIPDNSDFHCGLCAAKMEELLDLREENAKHFEKVKQLQAEIVRLRQALVDTAVKQ